MIMLRNIIHIHFISCRLENYLKKKKGASSDIIGEVSEFEQKLMDSHYYMEIRGKVKLLPLI